MLDVLYKKIEKEMRQDKWADFTICAYLDWLKSNDKKLSDELKSIQTKYSLEQPSIELIKSINANLIKRDLDYFIELCNKSTPHPNFNLISIIHFVLESENLLSMEVFTKILKEMEHFNSDPLSMNFHLMSQDYSALYANPKFAKEFLDLVRYLKKFPFDRVMLINDIHKLGKKYRQEAIEIMREDILITGNFLLTPIRKLKAVELIPDLKKLLKKNRSFDTGKEFDNEIKRNINKTIKYLEGVEEKIQKNK